MESVVYHHFYCECLYEPVSANDEFPGFQICGLPWGRSDSGRYRCQYLFGNGIDI